MRNLFKGHKNNLLVLARLLHHGNWKEHQRATTGANSSNPPSGKHLHIYMRPCQTFFFPSLSLSGLERACACRKHYLLADTDSRSSRRGWQRLQKHFPFCGAGLGPSHLNLAGLTWNSLPVGLPQTLHPKPPPHTHTHTPTPNHQPRQAYMHAGLPVNSSS